MSVKFQVSKSEGGEFFFKLLAAGGGTLVRSEGYNAKASCSNGIESVRKNGVEDGRYELKTASDGRPFFNIKSSNGQVVATSPMFADEAARSAAVSAIKAGVAAAAVEDNS
jgi:uncharacterized protein YegP (UPF0339 family)